MWLCHFHEGKWKWRDSVLECGGKRSTTPLLGGMFIIDGRIGRAGSSKAGSRPPQSKTASIWGSAGVSPAAFGVLAECKGVCHGTLQTATGTVALPISIVTAGFETE